MEIGENKTLSKDEKTKMVTKFTPEINKVYFINQYTLFQVLSGNGSIQVDFNDYFDWQDKLIYLEKGQYIKFLSADFVVRKIEFPSAAIFQHQDTRVLFKHLVSLGYINFNECTDCQRYLSSTVFSDQVGDILDVSAQQWYWQNPFHAKKEEYHLIFDIKEVIDQGYENHLSNQDLAALIQNRGIQAQALIKDKVGLSIKKLLHNKRLLESKKDIAFTDKSIQEISYDLGYKDPAYFGRIFRKATGKSPLQFREDFDFENRDLFIQDILSLLQTYHQQEHSLSFYAEKMHLSVKALSKKVKDKLNISLGQLIRNELIQTAKANLKTGTKINEVAYQLGFEEAHHFSAFFKHYTGMTPSDFMLQQEK